MGTEKLHHYEIKIILDLTLLSLTYTPAVSL